MSRPVIIVGDENKKLGLIKVALKNSNIEVIAVSTGYELTSSIFKYNPNLVIFNTSTRWINCFEFVKEINNSGIKQKIDFLFLCDKATEKYKSEYESIGIKCIGERYQMSDFIKYIQDLTKE